MLNVMEGLATIVAALLVMLGSLALPVAYWAFICGLEGYVFAIVWNWVAVAAGQPHADFWTAFAVAALFNMATNRMRLTVKISK